MKKLLKITLGFLLALQIIDIPVRLVFFKFNLSFLGWMQVIVQPFTWILFCLIILFAKLDRVKNKLLVVVAICSLIPASIETFFISINQMYPDLFGVGCFVVLPLALVCLGIIKRSKNLLILSSILLALSSFALFVIYVEDFDAMYNMTETLCYLFILGSSAQLIFSNGAKDYILGNR
jgi:hypothetical protein